MAASSRRIASWVGALSTATALAACTYSTGPDWPRIEGKSGAPAAAAAVAAHQEQNRADEAAGDGALAGLLEGQAAPPPPGGGAALVGQVRPLLVIRFAEPPADFRPALLGAVRRTLELRPRTGFDVVAVSRSLDQPGGGSLAVRAAEVVDALSAMGLPPDRLSLTAASAAGAPGDEVHVYVR